VAHRRYNGRETLYTGAFQTIKTKNLSNSLEMKIGQVDMIYVSSFQISVILILV